MIPPLLLISAFLLHGTQAYDDNVCSPKGTYKAGDTIPPCISIETIENGCAPNGTTPLAYLAHAQCMCSPPSSFFADWKGCQKCLFVHGARNEQESNKYASVMTLASNALCSGTPTAKWKDLFASEDWKIANATGATVSSDQFPGQTAVSLYYTTTGKQGSGVVTG
jgi:hypothetical protein